MGTNSMRRLLTAGGAAVVGAGAGSRIGVDAERLGRLVRRTMRGASAAWLAAARPQTPYTTARESRWAMDIVHLL
jgi:hypothetical protein